MPVLPQSYNPSSRKIKIDSSVPLVFHFPCQEHASTCCNYKEAPNEKQFHTILKKISRNF